MPRNKVFIAISMFLTMLVLAALISINPAQAKLGSEASSHQHSAGITRHESETPELTHTEVETETPHPSETEIESHTPQPGQTPTDCPNQFVDITGNIFYAAIHSLACEGVINGFDVTHYVPAGTATRGQFAKIVVLAFHLPLLTPTGGNPSFSDVPPSHFAYPYVETGKAAGILSGFDPATCQAAGRAYPCYLPEQAITRGQLTKLTVNAGHYPLITPSAGQTFSDVPPANVFYASIETAAAAGIVGGYPDRTFRPNNSIRRDEMAQIVYAAVQHRPAATPQPSNTPIATTPIATNTPLPGATNTPPGATNTPQPSNTPAPTNTPGTAATVSIGNDFFSPQSLTVSAGTTVTWHNNGGHSHTVTADDNSFDSGNIGSGGSYSHTFTTPGTYGYHCAYHGDPGQGMFGTITVTAP